MIKIVTFFLIGMAILAMFGKLRMPRVNRLLTKKCRRCGRYRVGRGPCPCEKPPGA